MKILWGKSSTLCCKSSKKTQLLTCQKLKHLGGLNCELRFTFQVKLVCCQCLARMLPVVFCQTLPQVVLYGPVNGTLHHLDSLAFLASLYNDYMLRSQTAKIIYRDYSFKPSVLRKFAETRKHKYDVCCLRYKINMFASSLSSFK